MAGSITRAQMSKIYALAAESGLDNDLLHETVRGHTGRDSIRKLTRWEANLIIDRLQGNLMPKGGVTPRQKRFIEGLLKDIGWTLEDGKPDIARLEAELLREKFHIESYKKLTSKSAGKVIEALKAMKVRAKESG